MSFVASAVTQIWRDKARRARDKCHSKVQSNFKTQNATGFQNFVAAKPKLRFLMNQSRRSDIPLQSKTRAPAPNVWQRRIHEPFVRAAILVALTTGFGYGAILVAMLAFGVVPGAWYSALVQSHGHAQLFGWLGCFILGMGLFFLPRLRGETLPHPERLRYVLFLVVGGIALRTIAQPLAGWFENGVVANLWRATVFGATLLEAAGLFMLLSLILPAERARKPLSPDAPAWPVLPFMQIGFFSLALAFILNLFGAWNAFTQARNIIPARYDQSVITLMLYGVALPMAIVFAIRNLPLFMRLAMPGRRGWHALAWIYALALSARLLPQLVAILDDALIWTGSVARADYLNVLGLNALATLGILGLNACILFFIWRLDILRLRPPWIVDRAPNTRPDLDYLRQPTRANYPDNGEYGRFELLINSAFVWLGIAMALDVLRVLPWVNDFIAIPQDGARHALMVGFITLLIFGMAARMAPGFSGRRGVAHPELVVWLFYLGNLAAILRVVPTFFPQSKIALMLWGMSGFIGWCAVLVLAVIMWGTFHRTSDAKKTADEKK